MCSCTWCTLGFQFHYCLNFIVSHTSESNYKLFKPHNSILVYMYMHVFNKMYMLGGGFLAGSTHTAPGSRWCSQYGCFSVWSRLWLGQEHVSVHCTHICTFMYIFKLWSVYLYRYMYTCRYMYNVQIVSVYIVHVFRFGQLGVGHERGMFSYTYTSTYLALHTLFSMYMYVLVWFV